MIMKNPGKNEELRLRELLATLIHDIRSPLTCLLVRIHTAKSLTTKDKLAIDHSINRINNIINSADMALYNDKPILDDMINLAITLEDILLEKKQEYYGCNIEFNYKRPENYSEINLNGAIDDLSRALSNLLNNALEACHGKRGVITIELNKIAGIITLVIADNGKGMPEEVLQKLRSGTGVTYGKQNGHGIGFGQITDAIKNLNGEITITSTLGKGTTITIIFNC